MSGGNQWFPAERSGMAGIMNSARCSCKPAAGQKVAVGWSGDSRGRPFRGGIICYFGSWSTSTERFAPSGST